MAKKRLIRGAGVALFGVLTLMSVTAVAQEVTRNRVVSEKSIVLSWAVLKWSVRSDRQADVSMFGCRSIPPLDSPPAVPTGV